MYFKTELAGNSQIEPPNPTTVSVCESLFSLLHQSLLDLVNVLHGFITLAEGDAGEMHSIFKPPTIFLTPKDFSGAEIPMF